MHPDYERFIAGIREYCPNARVIVDAGAFDGAGACDVKREFPDAEVVAIDPISLDVSTCNACRVTPLVGAVGAEYGVRHFTRSSQRGLTSMYSRNVDTDGWFHAVTMPLNMDIDALKLDVEGASADALEGLSFYPKLIQLETETKEVFAGQRLEDVCFEWLRGHGYSLVWLEKCEYQAESQWVRR